MRRSLYILLFLPALILINTGCTGGSRKKPDLKGEEKVNVKTAVLLNVNGFEEGINSAPQAQVIDVRTPEEFNKGHLKGALNINYQGDEFTAEVGKLDKSMPTYVYCQSGGRSSEACNYMANQNFTNLYDLDGGFSAWSHYKKPIEIPQE